MGIHGIRFGTRPVPYLTREGIQNTVGGRGRNVNTFRMLSSLNGGALSDPILLPMGATAGVCATSLMQLQQFCWRYCACSLQRILYRG